ncbi:MAG: 3-oxoacid CoA-transferase [Candidatus Wallbacteria bacterium HGW-Wallbacteria-1]|jgi:glutaconate CoA-transferase subunit B|uniref:3-oxoacid CoA-transferase n=1 Tax=Candidatus Wallbacteria bacterium HGW-Wallbacteria-1 TaxID=2013854 RepID=A0A2N1PKY9_9BACT|nr:MAG: 3-oxoacid CoA-transferase [Candidatus Wallbacteria bacterium HGW-Wallbacteria-1]
MEKYNNMELMITVAARNLEDGAVVLVGTGVPVAAAMLAQMTQSPNLTILFEAGGVSPILPTMPISVGDSRTTHKALKATSMAEIMEYCQTGIVDYCFLGGAQIDKYGNLNSTIIGSDYKKPKTRFPGSGGANDLASLCWKTMVVTPQNPKRFVEKVDFITSPGFLQGGTSRADSGLPLNTGPHRVITDIGVYGYHPETREMMLISLHPGKTLEEARANSSFSILVSDTLDTTHEPTDEELRILREKVDPLRVIIGRG